MVFMVGSGGGSGQVGTVKADRMGWLAGGTTVEAEERVA